MKLWEKGIPTDKLIEGFTTGRDREMDLYLAPFDVLGTMAHVRMLAAVGLLPQHELKPLLIGLRRIYDATLKGSFAIEEGVEDVHSQVELMLTRELGEMGKKVHSGRSRNDQVLTDLKLFIRHELQQTVTFVRQLFDQLQGLSELHRHVVIPGYTHLQIAMPSSFGLWFGAYAESLTDDMELLLAAWKITNQNPLGSAAGYGSSFPLNRQMTTDLLGFDRLNYNVVYAQMGRGKVERVVAFALANVASTLGRWATDACLFMSQNFGFISLPDALTTGSSIMPHKKNPDVFELLRAKCNKIQALPFEIAAVTGNLPSGYFRDMQIIKESFVPLFDEIQDCLQVAAFTASKIEVNTHILEDEKYRYLYSVEEVNREVLRGTPFRDAYKKVASDIRDGLFNPDTTLKHTHEGSLGNLCNDKVRNKMEEIINSFGFVKVQEKIEQLLSSADE